LDWSQSNNISCFVNDDEAATIDVSTRLCRTQDPLLLQSVVVSYLCLSLILSIFGCLPWFFFLVIEL